VPTVVSSLTTKNNHYGFSANFGDGSIDVIQMEMSYQSISYDFDLPISEKNKKRNPFFRNKHPGVDVMIKIFCDFCQFSAKKLAFFSKTNVMIKILHNLALF
jgi:hypothetical protein